MSQGTALHYPSAFAVFDHVPAFIYVLEVGEDRQPRYAALNAQALAELGRPASDFLGHSALEAFPKGYGRAAYARHCEVVSLAKPLTCDLTLPWQGGLRSVSATLTPEVDDTGRVVRIIGHDIDTETERQARNAKLEYDVLSSEMEDFMALAAHDLRAPMKNIAALTDLLRETVDGPKSEQAELLDIIDRITQSSITLVSDVLARVRETPRNDHTSVFSFPVLCHDMIEAIDPHHRHDIFASPISLATDRVALQIALRNLLTNAISHGGRDRMSINITADAGMPGMIDFMLTDDGTGFTEDVLAGMNSDRYLIEKGFGLFGLKRLISARGGTLVARNIPGRAGAAVRFSLPGKVLGQGSRFSPMIRGLDNGPVQPRFSA